MPDRANDPLPETPDLHEAAQAIAQGRELVKQAQRLLREEQDQAPQLSRRAMGEPEPPNVTWVLTADAWPNARWPRGPDFTAFDGELLFGRIFQHQDGPEKRLWVWTMS